jgi:RNA polymerase subunit RPABC4/transcription elongation factor Spt4
MAAPVLQGTTIKTSQTTSTTDTITLPASVASGDLLFVLYSIANTVSTPAGWTLELAELGGTGNLWTYVFSRVAAGAETTQDFTIGGTDTQRVAIAARVTGQHATWEKEIKEATNDDGSTNQATITSTQSGAVDDLALAFVGIKDADATTQTAPTGWTEAQDGAYTFGYVHGALHSKTLTATGAVTATVPFSNASSGFVDAWREYIILISPASSAAAVNPTGPTVTVTAGSPTVTRTGTIEPVGATVTVTPGTVTINSLGIDPVGATVTVSVSPVTVAQPVAAVLRDTTIKVSTTSSTTDTITMPGTVAAGDLLLVFFSIANTVATPAAWTLEDSYVASNLNAYLFSKVAAGGETTVDFTIGATDTQRVAIAARINGQHATWERETKEAGNDTGEHNSASLLSDNSASASDLALLFISAKDASVITQTPPSGWTEAQDDDYVSGFVHGGLHYKTTGSSGPVSATVTFSDYVDNWRGYLVIVAPAAVAGTGQPFVMRRQWQPHGSTANSTFRRGGM